MTPYKNHNLVARRHGTASTRPFLLLSLLFAAFALLLTLPAGAQLSGKGEIKGVVMDPTGAVVPGATIIATSASRGIQTTSKSTSAGDFSVSPLDPDTYTLTITAPGFQTTKQENVHVNALEIANVNVSLQLGSETESVEVSTAPPALETSNATLGATMENDMYSALPLQMGAYGQPDQRRATDFAYLMPGVQGNETNGNATTNTGVVNGSGSRGAASSTYIDGVPFTQASGEGDPRFVWTAISVDAVNQFQVETSGYSALYEGQGVQNYTIKQGGNKIHGAVWEYFRNTVLDTWGFFAPGVNNPLVGHATKPEEHQNEYGIYLSGPVWKDKLFVFGSYDGFRFSHGPTPVLQTAPTAAEMAGDFSALGINIYDPNTQTACTANSTNGPCRYQYGFGPGTGKGTAGNPVKTGAVNVIPASEFSPIALKMQSFPNAPLSNQNATSNQAAGLKYGLVNWMTTNRIDYIVSSKNTLTFVGAIGRQASSFPTGQTTAGRNIGPIPYNYGQAFAPKTAVGIIEDTHVFTSNVVNQFKYGFARYNGPTFNADQAPAYAATTLGITNLPLGQAQEAFPITTFSGTDAPTQWAGTTAGVSIANSYSLLDNVQWLFGRHTLTLGGEIAWLQYQVTPASGAGSTTQLTIANAVTETAAITPSSNTSPKYAATAGTGLAYASFLIGQIDKGSLTQNLVQETGARFRPISPYVQDDWKVSSRLTLNLGLRYDFYPTYREAHNVLAFFNPTLTNPITNLPGAIQYAGTGANTCNCTTPVSNYYKNFGPRLGFAFQSDSKTVWRGSWGVMYTHGNGVGGAANSRTGTGILGFSASPSFAANGFLLSTFPLSPGNTAFPSYAPALGTASGNGFGTGFTTVSGYTGTPTTIGYGDPYLGGRAPQYINWSFGFQHQWTDSFVSTISYVGSEGHFLITDGGNPRGLWSNALDPKYLSLGTNLGLTGTALTAFCSNPANNVPCPSSLFTSSQSLATALKPFPFAGVSDTYGNVANSIYHALQVSLMKRPSHGLTFMMNYTWSRSIDDGGTFRTGYAIPAAYTQTGKAYAADAIERTVSTSNQPHHLVLTGVWDLPGAHMGNTWTRAILGGFKFSEILQFYSGSPLAITGSACGTNPAQSSTCEPTYNPSYSGGSPRIHGAWGHGVTATNVAVPFINSTAFVQTPAYVFGNTPRTAPYNLYGPGNYDLDISLRRNFNLHVTEASHLILQADMYNVTNHTQFGGIGTTFGSTNFGQVASQANQSRDVQLTGRVEF